MDRSPCRTHITGYFRVVRFGSIKTRSLLPPIRIPLPQPCSQSLLRKASASIFVFFSSMTYSQQQHVDINSNVGSGSFDKENDDGPSPPLWNFVTKLEKMGDTGGTWKWQCSKCNIIRKSSYSKVRGHLLQLKGNGIGFCKSVTRSDIMNMQRLEEEFNRQKKDLKPKEVSLPCESQLDSGSSFKKRKSHISPIERCFGIEVRDQLDQEIAGMFYTGGLPFNLARNPHYMRSYTFAATHAVAGYKPPSYDKLRTTLLLQERNHAENLLVPLRSTWKEKGVTIVTDGWSDPARRPLINFMATSGSGPMFLKAVNCFGEVKDKFFIARLMKEVIYEVGDRNVVQIITDNAANCKGAGDLIQSEFPHIYWTPCVLCCSYT
ncbi:hypothetical protein QQ045_026269 [Rhodiola kirilowii]